MGRFMAAPASQRAFQGAGVSSRALARAPSRPRTKMTCPGTPATASCSMTDHKTATSTDAVHAGDAHDKAFDAVPTPVVQTATYTFRGTREVIDLMDGSHPH